MKVIFRVLTGFGMISLLIIFLALTVLCLPTKAGDFFMMVASVCLWGFVCYIVGEHVYNWWRGRK